MPNTPDVEVAHDSHYAFERGFPTDDTVTRAYDDADRDRAIQAYKFFYPTVSGAAIVRGNEQVGIVPNQVGIVPNKVFGILDCGPQQLVFTANSDTPYGPLLLDLSIGPLVVELQPGPLIVCSMDINQRWVADMGCQGPTLARAASTCWLGRTTRAMCRGAATTCIGPAATGRSWVRARCRSGATSRAPRSG
jgi:hypothetical protein